MQIIHGSRAGRTSVHGQALMSVLLLLMVLGLAGFTVYLYFKYDAAVTALTKSVDAQSKRVSSVKDSLEELDQQLKSQKDLLSEQKDKFYSFEKQSAAIKKVLDEAQSNMNKEIDAVKADHQKSQEAAQASLTNIERTIDGFSEQIKKMKEGLQGLAIPAASAPAVVPVVDVKVEPQVPATKGKGKEAKK